MIVGRIIFWGLGEFFQLTKHRKIRNNFMNLTKMDFFIPVRNCENYLIVLHQLGKIMFKHNNNFIKLKSEVH